MKYLTQWKTAMNFQDEIKVAVLLLNKVFDLKKHKKNLSDSIFLTIYEYQSPFWNI